MKQTRKRLLSIILACVMLLSLMPATALADESGETGENSTPKTITIAPPQDPLKSLPTGLQQVDYIESTSGGQQWIDLGFKPSEHPNQLKSEIDLQFTELPTSSGQYLGGAYTKGSSYYLIYGATASAFKMQSGGSGKEVTWSPSDKNRHTFILDQAIPTATLDGNSSSKALSGSTEGVETSVTLFKLNGDSSPYYSVMRLYSAKFSYWDEETNQYKPLRDLVPCYEIATGKAGLYDRVEGKFYANANTADGAADFKKGENVTELSKPLTVTLNQTAMICTGAELKPSVTVKFDGIELTKGSDYTVTYKNNTDIGTGTVEVKMSSTYGSKYVRMSFTITAPEDIYYQETGDETSRLYIRVKDGKLYMFLPATANYENLKLHLPVGTVLKYNETSKTLAEVTNGDGALDMTALFGSDMEPGKEYSLTVTANGQTYNMVLIQSANIPALYITMGGLENSSTKDKVTGGDPYIWLDDYINQSKDWKATEGSVLMVNADGTAVTTPLKSLKGRGSGSWTYGGNKKSYNIKLEEKQELVPGAGAAKNWCLISNYMTLGTHDSTGLANSTAYWLYDEIGGEAAMQYQQVDLYVNGVYRGTYSLTEKVEINKKRVNITETEYATEEGTSTKVIDAADPAIAAGIQEYYYSNGTTLASQTSGGGFLLEVNDYYDEVCKFKTKQGVKFTLKEPEYATKEQVQQIAIYVQEFEDALFSDTGYNSKGKHYSEYVDLESLAKKLIVDAFMGNGDSMKNSGYFHIDATTSGESSALQVNFGEKKMLAGPAWDYDYWISFTDTENLWTNNNCHGKVWLDKLLTKGDFIDILYQLNETSFKSALADGSAMLSALVETLTPSKTMEDVFMGNGFAAKSAATITKYTNRLAVWNSTVWNSGRLMGVTLASTPDGLLANVNGTAASYQWYKLDGNHNAIAIEGATEATYTPTEAGEYQVAVTGTSMEPALGATVTMYSAPITVKSGSYTLTLDPCGGTLPENAKTINVTPDNRDLALPTPTKEGCYFLGWFTRPEGGTQIISGSTAPAYGTDSTLYARWKTTTTVQDVDDVTGVAITSDSGSVIWKHEGEGALLTGLILYGNSETGTAPSAELSVPRLPAEYQEVEYIESTSGGQQWIDLGFSPSEYPNLLKSEIDLQYTVLPTGGAQGLGGAYTSGSAYYLVYGATASAFKLQSGGDKMEVTWTPSDTNRHTFVLDQKAATATLDGNSSSKALSGSTEGVTANVTLFAMNNSGSPTYFSAMQLYSTRFWANDVLIRDLVPCYKTATGQAGLYDLVEGTFYTNANAGSTADFVAGPEAYTAGAGAVTVTSPATLYAFGDVRDSYNAATGVVTRRVKVENGTAVAALPKTEWTTEQYTAAALTQYAGLNCAAYKNSYEAPITVVHVPAAVTLSASEFTYNGSEQKPDVTVTINGTTLTEGTDYTVTWPDDVTSAGEKQIRITINNADYNGTLIRTYTVTAPVKETTPAANFTATGPDTGTLSGVSAGMKYSTNGTDWTDINSGDDINLTGLSACTISVVKKGNGSTTIDSDAKEITVTKAVIPNLTPTQPGTIGGKGSIPTTEAHEFSRDNSTWSACTGTTENLEPGTYYVRVKAGGTVLASDAQNVVIRAVSAAYTITFDPNGGAVTQTTGITGADGRLTELPTPTRSGSYTFNGWYTAASGGTQVTVSTAFDADTTIYARWTYTGSSSSKYPITVPADVSNGAVAVSPRTAGRGTVVTITVTPDEGYKLDTLTATDANGSKLTLTDKGNGVYTYVMPASKVSIEATFTEIADTPEPPAGPFVDVKKEDYFYDAVQWAVDNGITEGTSDTTFSPNAVCTRAQMVTFLWRAAGCPMPNGSENPFTDVAADTYYYIAVLWAVENGITNGTSTETFSPDAVCTRAQAVTFLHRAAGMPEAGAANTFTDVRADAYYTGAVDWAVKEKITNGTGNNAFSPDADCTRGQIVTFLYRAAQ